MASTSAWSDENTKILYTLSDRKGVRIRILELLAKGPQRLETLSNELPDNIGMANSSLIEHLRDLQKIGWVIQEGRYRKYMLICPEEVKEFLQLLAEKLSETAHICNRLYTRHKEANKIYAAYITLSEREQLELKPLLVTKLDPIYGNDFGRYNLVLRKLWMERAVHPDVMYDFARLLT